MITPTPSAIARHHLVVREWIIDSDLSITEYSVSEYSLSISLRDPQSLRHAYDLLTMPGTPRPQVTVFEGREYAAQFGPHSFVMIKGYYLAAEQPLTEVHLSLLVTAPAELDLLRLMKPSVALIESLASPTRPEEN